MSTTNEPEQKSYRVMHKNGTGARLATKPTNSQISRPAVDFDRAKAAVTELLLAIGEDPNREGLEDTPRRVANFWREFIEHNTGKLDTTFESIKRGQLVMVRGMRVWSLCEHHLMPFWCDVTFAYVSDDKVIGLSKIARIAHAASHRLQLQERLVYDIGRMFGEIVNVPSVAVHAKGEHLCMTMRGVKTHGTMESFYTTGEFANGGRYESMFYNTVT